MEIRAIGVTRAALVGVTAAAALGAAVLTAPAAGAAEASDTGHQATQAAMDTAVKQGVPGVVGQARDEDGVWNGHSGVADLTTRRERGMHDRFRAGSITKTFVATVLLQLQAEGKVDLDATVDSYLPGLVDGNGHDGSKITVRQLMNHTSGIFNFTEDAAFKKTVMGIDFLEHRYDTWTPQQVIAAALKNRPYFEPGTSWHYSNTNYLIAGLIVEKVTGHPYAAEVERRILGPLKLRATSFPGTRSDVPGPSGRAYSTFEEDPGKTYDVTELNPSWAWAAGELITNSSDLDRFYTALLRGRLLRPAQLDQMMTTVSTEGGLPRQRYGLGLIEYETTCGVKVWGHSGGIHGSTSQAFSTKDGRHSVALNFNGDWTGGGKAVVSAEFCGPQS